MNLSEWYAALPKSTQDILEDWGEISSPTTHSQDHYSIEDAAIALRLSQITLRQYVREGKVFGRRIGRKWLVPSDSIARYIYNAEHTQPAEEAVPIGVVVVWADEEGSALADYQFASATELSAFSDVADLSRFMNITPGRGLWCELWPVLAYQEIYRDTGLIPAAKPSSKSATLAWNEFSVPPHLRVKLAEMAGSDWHMAPLELIEAEYKAIFGKMPDLNDLRLLRLALLGMLSLAGETERIDQVRRVLMLGPLSDEFGHM